MRWSYRSVASGAKSLPAVVNRREELCLQIWRHQRLERLQERAWIYDVQEGIESQQVQVVGMALEIRTFRVSGPGTAALSHTVPAATASFKAGLVLEDLGVAHPDGSFSRKKPL